MSIHVQASDAILIRTRAVSEKMTPITVYIGVSDRQLLQDGVQHKASTNDICAPLWFICLYQASQKEHIDVRKATIVWRNVT